MPSAYATIDLGFGDSGKGTVVDYLSQLHKVDIVVRYNGGAQAAHNVVTDDGKHHTFNQFGSATLAGIPTALSKDVLVSPTLALTEAKRLESLLGFNPIRLLHCDTRCRVNTVYHQVVNRAREFSRGDNRHGSCGLGIGETVKYALDHPSDVLLIEDLRDSGKTLSKLGNLRDWAVSEIKSLGVDVEDPHLAPEIDFLDKEILSQLSIKFSHFYKEARVFQPEEMGLFRSYNIVFEGSQGVLLDEDYGFHPYTTWSHCTFKNVDDFLNEAGYWGSISKIGITRSYTTRHGVGPMPTECDEMDAYVQEMHNSLNPWQSRFRNGWLDLNLLRYSLSVLGHVNAIAVTHCDLFEKRSRQWKVCDLPYFDEGGVPMIDVLRRIDPNDFQAREERTKALMNCTVVASTVHSSEYLRYISDALNKPIYLTSSGPRTSDKKLFMY